MKNKLSILKEIDEQTLENEGLRAYLQNNSDPSLYQFVNVMGDKWRIALPIFDEERLKIDIQMVDYFEEIDEKLGFEIDPETLIGEKTGVFIDKNGQEFKKSQKMSVGKLMNKLSEEAAEFWQKHNGFYTDPKNAGYFLRNDGAANFYLIVSRHPIDILRMSDFKDTGIESCHSRTGSYFNCAVDESKSGSIIGYVITKEQYYTIKDDLQSNEIFYDKDRKIDGPIHENDKRIYPIFRIRARFVAIKLKIKDTKQYVKLLVPEKRIYGTFNSPSLKSNLFSTFLKFLSETQKDEIEKLIDASADPSNHAALKIFYTGGIYADNKIQDLLQDLLLFGRKLSTTNIKMFGDDAKFKKEKNFNSVGATETTISEVMNKIQNFLDGLMTRNGQAGRITIEKDPDRNYDYDEKFDTDDVKHFDFIFKYHQADVSEERYEEDQKSILISIFEEFSSSYYLNEIVIENNIIKTIDFSFWGDFYYSCSNDTGVNEEELAKIQYSNMLNILKRTKEKMFINNKKLSFLSSYTFDEKRVALNASGVSSLLLILENKSYYNWPDTDTFVIFFRNFIFEQVNDYCENNVNEKIANRFKYYGRALSDRTYDLIERRGISGLIHEKIANVLKKEVTVNSQVDFWNRKEMFLFYQQNIGGLDVIFFISNYKCYLYLTKDYISKSTKDQIEENVQVLFKIKEFLINFAKLSYPEKVNFSKNIIPAFDELVSEDEGLNKDLRQLLSPESDYDKLEKINSFQDYIQNIIDCSLFLAIKKQKEEEGI